MILWGTTGDEYGRSRFGSTRRGLGLFQSSPREIPRFGARLREILRGARKLATFRMTRNVDGLLYERCQ